jgi:cholesterol transport system auxiliary component
MTARPRFRPGISIAVLAAVAVLPLLAGCGGILSKPPQRDVYRSAPVLAFAGLPRHVAAQLVVATPTANGGLDSKRIALSRAPVALDYFADVEWTDRVPLLVQTALIDGFAKSGVIPGGMPSPRRNRWK